MHDFKIGKPQQHRPGKWRCSIGRAGARVWGPLADSPQKAERAAALAAETAESGMITVRQAIELYLEQKRIGGARARSVITSGQQLWRFFGRWVDAPIASLTPAKASALYAEVRTKPGPTGKVLAVSTQRACLKQAKMLLGWCLEQRLTRTNPCSGLKPVGVSSSGKAQLRLDEARRVVGLCLPAAQAGDAGALAVLLALLCGLRAGEITSRTVRDLDAGGTILCIDDTASGWKPKSRASRRQIAIPEFLQPLLVGRAVGRAPGALLIESSTGRAYNINWPNRNTARFCRLAGVPKVCAHSMRGLHATLAIEAGASPRMVADVLGHESSTITLAAYALPGSQETGRARHAVGALLN